MNPRIATILALALAIIGGVLFATAAKAAEFTPVTLLHWNNGGGGSYEEITVDTEGALNGHCRSHPLDIIPLGACDFLTPTVQPTATLLPTAEPTSIPPTEIPTSIPTSVSSEVPPTEIANPTPTEIPPTPAATEVPSEPTDVVTETPPEPIPTVPPICVEIVDEPCGYLFHLVGPDGQEADFASFSPRPDGGWYLPNVGSQLNCLGWIAVAAPYGRPLYGNDVLTSCDGGRCYQEGQ